MTAPTETTPLDSIRTPAVAAIEKAISESFYLGVNEGDAFLAKLRRPLQDIAEALGMDWRWCSDWSQLANVVRAKVDANVKLSDAITGLAQKLEDSERKREALWNQNSEFGERIGQQAQEMERLKATVGMLQRESADAYERAKRDLIARLNDDEFDDDIDDEYEHYNDYLTY